MTSPSPYGSTDDPVHTPSEADVVTPVRGVQQVHGEAPPPAPSRRRAPVTVAIVVALVVGLVGSAWISTEFLRTSWVSAEPRVAHTAEAGGAVTLDGLTVSLVEAVDLGQSPSLPGTDWTPPQGFHAWRVVLASESTNADLFGCRVDVVDDEGRVFETNYFVDSFAEGYDWSYDCSVPEPDDDVGPQQALLALLPADAQPQTVRVWSTELNPDYLEFDVP